MKYNAQTTIFRYTGKHHKTNRDKKYFYDSEDLKNIFLAKIQN